MQTFNEFLQEKINELNSEIKKNSESLQETADWHTPTMQKLLDNDIKNKCMLLALYKNALSTAPTEKDSKK